MSRALEVAQAADRERTAARLLKSSAEKFYDPDVDVDWSAPPVDGLLYQPEHRISLYGTYLWDRLSPEQRIELSRHEVASVASNGIWFEVILMQLLLKEIYRGDPTTSHVQYALTEIADECRHSTMFGKAIAHFGLPAYGPRKLLHRLGKLLPVVGYGPALYGSVLIVEEVLDRFQREAMADEHVQPMIRMVNRIHVLEADQTGVGLPAMAGRAGRLPGHAHADQPARLPFGRAGPARGVPRRDDQPALPGEHPLGRRADHGVPDRRGPGRRARHAPVAQVVPGRLMALRSGTLSSTTSGGYSRCRSPRAKLARLSFR
jgi:hypothetical protein